MDLEGIADRLADSSSGLVRRRDLMRAGVSASAVTRAASHGRLVRVGVGLYSVGSADRTSALVVAAAEVCGVLSHGAAAFLLGLDLLAPPHPHVTIRPEQRYRGRRAVGVTRRALGRGDVMVVDGAQLTTPLRTVLDCMRDAPLRESVVVADSALRRGALSLEELTSAVASIDGRGSVRARRALALVDPLSGSALESVLRVVLHLAGLAPDQSQREIRDRDGRFVARVDFWYSAGLIVEADGFDHHAGRASWRRDVRRANAFAALGLQLLRFCWEDVLHRPDEVVASVRAVLAAMAA